MTIAACFTSAEGVVLAADSTTTMTIVSGDRRTEQYYNHAQKLFEVGEASTLGIVTWGMGALGYHSHRTLIAEFGDEIKSKPATTMDETASAWSARVWNLYCAIPEVASLRAKYNEANDSEKQIIAKATGNAHVVGYCFAGRAPTSRRADAYEILFSPLLPNAPMPKILPHGVNAWGAPLIAQRLLLGVDKALLGLILESGKWSGTREELGALVQSRAVTIPPLMPLRDAAGMLHSIIRATIDVMRFSLLEPVCGGPIEVATITNDRAFRWISHKPLDAAIE